MPRGVNVIGYLRAELGIGEAARGAIAALDAARVPLLPVGYVAVHSRQGHSYHHHAPGRFPFPVNLLCVNADGVAGAVENVGSHVIERRYNIGLWFWEISTFPERWLSAFEPLDEVWVASDFIAETLRPISPIPVVKVTIPVEPVPPRPMTRAELGMPEGFAFLFSWDYNSIFARKNPLGLVEAYRRAFGPGDGTALVLKSINNVRHAGDHARLLAAVEDRPDIVVIDRYVSPDEKNAMMASADCYVSLHRSEGLGITLAEAMHVGTPVIGTGYSGTLDFMTPENSWLVDYRMTAVGAGSAPYPPDAEWAEPDLDQAAAHMRRVIEFPDEARARAERAAADIRRTHSAAAAGAVMAQRLESIEASVPAVRPVDALPHGAIGRTGTGPLRDRVHAGYGDGGRRGLRRRLRTAALRLTEPYASYDREIAEQMLAMVDGIVDDVAERTAEVEMLGVDATTALMAELRRVTADLRRAQATHAADGARAATHLRALQTAFEAVHEALVEVQAGVAELRGAQQALPYMAGEPFGLRDEPVAGRVLGFEAPAPQRGDGDEGADSGAGAEGADGDGYLSFEDVFRGPEAFIRERQRVYLDVIGDRAPVLDVGCGRGEFLDLLAEAGIAGSGVDLDAGMVARTRAKGHDVAEGDGIAALAAREDASLGAIFSAQVIEHLPYEQLVELLRLATRKLRPGGLLIAETVNPHSAPALKAFWVDPTHQHPLFPEVMLQLCRTAGFASAYVFHPLGDGDVEADRFRCGEYAVVARVASAAGDRAADAEASAEPGTADAG